jgi:hypothetical protein
MPEYKVKTKFVLEGEFNIKAENANQAREFVDQHCGLVIEGGIHSSLSADEVDWEFNVHPKKIIGRVRRVK